MAEWLYRRLIGSIRRECLDHVIVFGEGTFAPRTSRLCHYYNANRTHWSLGKDAPLLRPVQRVGRIALNPYSAVSIINMYEIKIFGTDRGSVPSSWIGAVILGRRHCAVAKPAITVFQAIPDAIGSASFLACFPSGRASDRSRLDRFR